MRRLITTCMWACLITAGIVGLAEYLHPATFTNGILYGLLAVVGITAIITIRHE